MKGPYDRIFEHVTLFCSQGRGMGLEKDDVLSFLWRKAAAGVPSDHLDVMWLHLQAFALFLWSDMGQARTDILKPWDYSRFICGFYPKHLGPVTGLPRETFVEIQKGALQTIVDYLECLEDFGRPCGVLQAQEAFLRMFEEEGKVKKIRRPSGHERGPMMPPCPF